MTRLLWVSLVVLVPIAVSGCKVTTSCFDDLDCGYGDFCASDGYCADDPVYETCFDDLDCAGYFCESVATFDTSGGLVTSGEFCTSGCTSDIECFDGYAGDNLGAGCYNPDGTFRCFERCTDDFDCEFGTYCFPTIRTDLLMDYICLPN